MAGESLKFRDPELAKALAAALARHVEEIGRPVSVMHVCGSHEQAIAKFGLRSMFPKLLTVIMGPGCPVCVTDVPEVDEGVVLAEQGVHIATYGDMLKVPGTVKSLADAQATGGKIHIVYSPAQAVELDLSAFAGMVPEEMLGRTRFPAIGELPYLLTFAPRGFFWFQLRKEQ